MKSRPQTILGQPSWVLRSDSVDLAVTQLGGFLGPVEFRTGRRTFRPLALPPWAGKRDAPAGALGAFRGDAFCLPFGGNAAPYRGEKHPPHGDPFHGQWRFVAREREARAQQLTLDFNLRTRPGKIRKEVTVRDGEPVIYQRHTISGLRGKMSYGYHATLDFSECGEGRLGFSRVLFGRTQRADFEDPVKGGYCSLRPDTVFSRLSSVPRSDGTHADLTRYPAENGFENLVLLASDPALQLAWTTATFARAGFVWFSLKRPDELSCTLLWMSNGGRHYPPWNGRHRQRLGLEEVTALPEGLAEAAAANNFTRRGIPVCRTFYPQRPVVARSAMGVCAVPRHFDVVQRVRLAPGRVVLTARSGAEVSAPFDDQFFG